MPGGNLKIEIRDLLGKPYKKHGRGPDAYDCYGCLIEVYRRYGKTVPDAIYDILTPEIAGHLIQNTASFLDALKIPTPREEAAVVINMGGRPRHVGVCVSDTQFIHCWRQGVTVSDLSSWTKRIEGFYLW